jgi:hypothetical protein
MGVTMYIKRGDKDTWLLRYTFKIDPIFRRDERVVCEYSNEILAWNL